MSQKLPSVCYSMKRTIHLKERTITRTITDLQVYRTVKPEHMRQIHHSVLTLNLLNSLKVSSFKLQESQSLLFISKQFLT